MPRLGSLGPLLQRCEPSPGWQPSPDVLLVLVLAPVPSD